MTTESAAGSATEGPAPGGTSRIVLRGVPFDALTEAQVVEHVAAGLARGAGGHLVTPNIDIVRQARRDAEARSLVTGAGLVVADGTPILWGARLARRPLPARVTGASLIWTLSEAMARDGRSIYLLGGGAPGVPERAGEVLAERYPGLRVAGASAPPMGFDRDERQVAAVAADLAAAKPDLVFVGLGFPRQDRLITVLRPALPGAWFVGCGAAIPFAAGEMERAPEWMQRAGLEWLHRLVGEPRRLFGRYILHDLPFAARFLTGCALDRLRR
ncbi:WecB/TagA/CpsF family glycosyltransferase [Actinomadura soli]|uniref:WecB/TagA/CpsF family glycosyltransferase n=1 Tax=Actinomadura soli TaxID=2508997 RepID=A0A5C4JDH5_9ACTN|nr:WecB/TagA/CpsF family glycosyltransferase [Actinomadura soli]TMR01686.1 WecB/TagA/CpsF family glycosyltransferase [Actinomadura soli]